jgi:hypothetical protein
MNMSLSQHMRSRMRVPYALRRVPSRNFSTLSPCPRQPQPGTVALARLEKIGKNACLELANGRPVALHEGDLLAVVFGNRYATDQFEGYARTNGDKCDLLSIGGLCGLVTSKQAHVAEPSKLRILGALGDADGRPLQLREYSLPPAVDHVQPQVVAVCGTSMDAGKTHTAVSLIMGLCDRGQRVAGIKLTGTASGRDTRSMLDAGASPALDFIDGGLPSTYLATLADLVPLHYLLLTHAASQGARWAVVELADGVLQPETAALLQCSAFARTVSHWVFTTADPLDGDGGVRVLRGWGIEPAAISGTISTSPLAVRQVESATGIKCLTAKELRSGERLSQLFTNGCSTVARMICETGRRKVLQPA